MRTDIVEVVHDFLAVADATVTASNLQEHLKTRFGARASIILSRKVRASSTASPAAATASTPATRRPAGMG